MARVNPTDPLESIDVRDRTQLRTQIARVKQKLFNIGEENEDPKVQFKYFRNMAARYGGGFVIARRQSGNLWSWGCSASEGQLGLGNTTPTSTPTMIDAGGIEFSRVFATGRAHTIALDTSGAPWTWGDNQYGQLGIEPIVVQEQNIAASTGQTDFRKDSNFCALAQTFTPSSNWVGESVSFYIRRIGNPTGNMWVELRDTTFTTDYRPNNILATSELRDVSTMSTSLTYQQFNFDLCDFEVNSGTVYAIVLRADFPLSSSDYFRASVANNAYSGGVGQVCFGDCTCDETSEWTNIGTNDINFQIIGSSSSEQRNSPSTIIGNLTGFAAAAGWGHSLMIDQNDNFVWAWGLNSSGQLGVGDTTDRCSPVSITLGNGRRFRKIDAGDNFSIALDQRNQAWTWGDNQLGQLGIGIPQAGGNDANTLLLLDCDGADGHTTFTDSSSGGNHGTATVNGNVEGDTAEKQWGTASLNNPGGDNDYIYFPDSPDWDVATYTDYTIETWVKHDNPVGIEHYMQQRLNDNNIWYFGNETSGSVNGLFFAIYFGGVARLLVQEDGTEITDNDWHHVVMCKVGNDWGIYKDGQQVAYINSSYSDSINGPLYISWGQILGQKLPLDGHLDEVRIRNDNYFGAAPNSGKTDTIAVPTGPYGAGGASEETSPIPVAGNKKIIEIAAGSQSGYGIDTLGTIYSWGNNTYGQLGDNTTITPSGSPVSVAGRHSFIQVTGGGRESQGHACALKPDGSVWCWGRNHHGQLGLCDYTDRSSPESVIGRHSFIDVWAAKDGYNTIAIKLDGSVWVWGKDPFCDGVDYCSPVSVPDFNLITLNILGRGYLEDHSNLLEI